MGSFGSELCSSLALPKWFEGLFVEQKPFFVSSWKTLAFFFFLRNFLYILVGVAVKISILKLDSVTWMKTL